MRITAYTLRHRSLVSPAWTAGDVIEQAAPVHLDAV